jgi:GrpB-like predicted nucleotidyltransferase (UPF0157 family)
MVIEKYNLEWVNQFEKIKGKLSQFLMGINVKIEHIGSTSVPQLDAKPIIDIDIIYYQVADFECIKNSLESFGYYHNGNQGIEGREVFKRNINQNDEILDKIPHHLYACKSDCEELHRHILSRDYLRKNEIAREFYQNLKYQIAEEANQDRKLYAHLKQLKANSFIDYIIELSRNEFLKSTNLENNI